MKKIALALQGGGSHGAYTWGVIEALLDEPGIEIEGVIGTSAGALNAAALAMGLSQGSRESAKNKLAELWNSVGELYKSSPVQLTDYQKRMQDFDIYHNPMFQMASWFSKHISPYQLSSCDHPLKVVVERTIDFDLIKASKNIKLFLAATHVNTGKLKIFSDSELSTNALLASTCIPNLFKTIEVDGEYFWDGGYVGNPAIFPLIYRCKTSDIIVVPLRCAYDPRIPTTTHEIDNRVAEITQNSSLWRELRTIHMVKSFIEKEHSLHDKVKQLNMHMIRDDSFFASLQTATGYYADQDFLNFLYNEGKRFAKNWLKLHLNDIGVRSTLNYVDEFMDPQHDYYDN